jgi:hypothetical protein
MSLTGNWPGAERLKPSLAGCLSATGPTGCLALSCEPRWPPLIWVRSGISRFLYLVCLIKGPRVQRVWVGLLISP